MLLDSEAGRSLQNHDSLVSQTRTNLHVKQEQQRKAKANEAFYEQRVSYDRQATVAEDPLQVWQTYLEKLNDPGRIKDLSPQLVQGEVQRVERTMQQYRAGQANALGAELMRLGQRATGTSADKPLWEEFVRLLEEDPRSRYLDGRQQGLAMARTQLKIYEDSAEPDPEILLARAEDILNTASDIPEVWRQQQLKIIQEGREVLRAEQDKRENQARPEQIHEDQLDLSLMPEPPLGADGQPTDHPNPDDTEQQGFTEQVQASLEEAEAHNSLWDELQLDSQLSCDAEGCPNDFELSYDGQLLAMVGVIPVLETLLAESGPMITALTTHQAWPPGSGRGNVPETIPCHQSRWKIPAPTLIITRATQMVGLP